MDLTIEELNQITRRQQQLISTQKHKIREREILLSQLKKKQVERDKKSLHGDSRSKLVYQELEKLEHVLKHLRNLKKQVEHYRANNDNTKSEIAVMRSLFTSKQRDLAMLLGRFDELTRQQNDLEGYKREVLGSNADSSQMYAEARLQVSKNKEVNLAFQNNLLKRLHEQLSQAQVLDQRIAEIQWLLSNQALHQQQAQSSSRHGDIYSRPQPTVNSPANRRAPLMQPDQITQSQLANFPSQDSFNKSPENILPHTTVSSSTPLASNRPMSAQTSSVQRSSLSSTSGAPPSQVNPPVPMNGEPVTAFVNRQEHSNQLLETSSTSSGSSPSRTEVLSNPTSRRASPHLSSIQKPTQPSSGAPIGSPNVGRKSSDGSKTPPRYASQSVINSTYMRRRAQDSLEKYKRTAEEVYRTKLAQVLSSSDPSGSSEVNCPPSVASVSSTNSVIQASGLPSSASPPVPSNQKQGSMSIINREDTDSPTPQPLINPTLASGNVDKAAFLRSMPSPRFLQRISSHEDIRGDSSIGVGSGVSALITLSDLNIFASSNWSSSSDILKGRRDILQSRQKYLESVGATSGKNTEDKFGLQKSSETPSLTVVQDPNTKSEESLTLQSSLSSICSNIPGLHALSLQPTKSCLKALTQPSADNNKKASTSENTNTLTKKRNVKFDPLTILLDSSQEGDLELVKTTAEKMEDVSQPNEEGITALHNAICAGHSKIVECLIQYGADVNAGDADGWTPLHCAASCAQLNLARMLVEAGAVLGARTLTDLETPLEKCDFEAIENTECEEYLYDQQQKLGVMNNGRIYAVISYTAEIPEELNLEVNEPLTVLKKPTPGEPDWFWCRNEAGQVGWVARNYISSYALLPQAKVLTEKRLKLADAAAALAREKLACKESSVREKNDSHCHQEQPDGSIKTSM